MKIIKFGGTSIQTPTLLNNVVDIISSYSEKVIVIISAIGRKGFPYASDTLIENLKGNYLSDKELDRFLALGETYASVILSNELNKRHVNAYSLSYREIGFNADKNYLNGEIVSFSKDKIKKLYDRYKVIIIPGFIAKSSEHEVITLGRGTSDYSSVLMALLFEENEVTLYKDVDGIYPTIQYPLTKLIGYEFMSYDQALSLCDIGYGVINKKALMLAKEKNIKLIIKNFLTSDKSTIINNCDNERKVIGFNLVNNEYLIASFDVNKLQEELDILFKKRHIFVKNYQIKRNILSFQVSSSQTLLVRQIILNTYFKDLMK